MSLQDVIEQKNGSKPTMTTTDSGGDTNTTSSGGETISLAVNGTAREFDILELILGGIVLADLLLLYVAIRV